MGHNIFNDSVLGKLEWDQEHEWWRSQIRFAPDHDITLSIHGRDLEAVLEARRDTFKHLRDHEPRLRIKVAEQMLEDAEAWRDPDEEPDPITVQSFTRRVRLESISLYDNGSAALYYNDGNIFADNWIVASVNANGELEEANVAS